MLNWHKPIPRNWRPACDPQEFSENNQDRIESERLADKSSHYVDNFEWDSAEYIDWEKEFVLTTMRELYDEYIESF